jgi:hypothetical protein
LTFRSIRSIMKPASSCETAGGLLKGQIPCVLGL